ncbi:uncharacterized protein LOC134686822 [Mytilus trossulus]|uniref:uncharacterized protein LOC134686822 n=1 Tax=Mytilus trossulus TaxID=6551 RepID=UPI003003B4DA
MKQGLLKTFVFGVLMCVICHAQENNSSTSNFPSEHNNNTSDGGNTTTHGGTDPPHAGNTTSHGGNNTSHGGNNTSHGGNNTSDGQPPSQGPPGKCPPNNPKCQANPSERCAGQDPRCNNLPSEYPSDYYESLKRSFPRRDFTCPEPCRKTCLKRAHCLTKDYRYKFAFPFINKLQSNFEQTGMLIYNNGVLNKLDDHLTCEDATKFIRYFLNIPNKEQDRLFGITNATSDSPAIEDIKPFIPFLRLFKNTTLQNMMKTLSESSKIQMCSQLMYLDCRVQLAFLQENEMSFCQQNSKNFQPSLDLVRNFLIDRDGDFNTWSNVVWENNVMNYMYVMQADTEFLKLFPEDLMFQMLKNSSDGCKEIESKHLRQVVREKLSNVLKKSQDPQEKSAAIRLLQSCGGKLKNLEKYATDAQILDSFDSTTAKVSPRDKAKMRRILKTEKADPSLMTKDEIVRYSSLIMNDKQMMNGLNTTALEEAICVLGDKINDINQARKLKSVLTRLNKYNDLTVYTKDKIICLKNLLGTLSPRQIASLPNGPLGEAINDGALIDVTFSCQVARSVLKQYLTYVTKPNGDMSSAELLALPPSIKVCLRARDIAKIPAIQLTLDVINKFTSEFQSRNLQAPESMIRRLIGKVKGDSNIIAALAKTPLGKFIPSAVLRKSVDMGQEIADQLNSGEPLTFHVGCKKANYLYGELTNTIGPPTADNLNWTTGVYRALQESNILSGMPLRHLKNISDSQIFEVADAFLASKCITGNQKKIILQKFLSVQQVNATTVTSEDIQNMDPQILFNQKEEELAKYGVNHIDDICSVIARIDVSQVPMGKILQKAHFCTTCMDAPSLSMDNVTDCGALICALPLTKFDRLDDDSLTQNGEALAVKCQWGLQKRKKIINLALQRGLINSPNAMTDVDIMTLKTLIADFTPDDLDEIPVQAFALAESAVVQAFKDRDSVQEARRLKGFKSDFSDKERITQQEGTLHVFKKIIQIKLSGVSSRKKRDTSAYTLTCDDLKSLGSVGLPAVSEANLMAVNDSEFQDCLLTLGQVTHWLPDQKETLAQKMISIYGTPGNWTSETIGTAGSMIQGLSVSDINTLNMDINSVSSLGQLEGWTDEQKRSAYTVFMTNVKNGLPASNLSSTELTALGNFICGMLSTEIDTISPVVYMDSAEAVGGLTHCSATQLQSFAGLAKHADAFGDDISQWDESTVSTVGILIGALSVSEVSALSPGQIDSIDPNMISYFPVEAMKSFTSEQLHNFSPAQAEATTSDQRSQLSHDQFISLQTAAGTSFSDGPSGGCSLNSVVWMLTLTLAFGVILETI